MEHLAERRRWGRMGEDPFQAPVSRARLAMRWTGVVLVVAVPMLAWWQMVWMPGESHAVALPDLNSGQAQLAEELRRDVVHLAEDIGERNLRHPLALDAAADWIEQELRAAGHSPRRQTFNVKGHPCHNIEVTFTGSASRDAYVREAYVVGAHYDSALKSPGANDNGSGVAALLAIARRLDAKRLKRTVHLVFFTNEEPPHFQGPDMGSVRHAQQLRERGDNVLGMLSLETMGYYTHARHSQHYPGLASLFYPDTGNFIAFVGDLSSRELTHRVITAFRHDTPFPSEGTALARKTPGVGWSDHWAYWQAGYPALMVSDTAPFRYPHYHTKNDTPDKLDYGRLARVTEGLVKVIEALAGGDEG